MLFKLINVNNLTRKIRRWGRERFPVESGACQFHDFICLEREILVKVWSDYA